jgi:hypothetical protein
MAAGNDYCGQGLLRRTVSAANDYCGARLVRPTITAAHGCHKPCASPRLLVIGPSLPRLPYPLCVFTLIHCRNASSAAASALAADALYGRVHKGAVEETLQPDALKKHKYL